MMAVKDYFVGIENPVKIYDFDGNRIEFKDWWFNLRMSNTEPYLRLLVEARTENMLKEKIETIRKIIQKFN